MTAKIIEAAPCPFHGTLCEYVPMAHKSVEQAAEIERLRAENASLATWQCEFTDGKTGLVYGEGGSTYCAMAKEVERLRAALREIMGMDEVAIVDFKKGDGWLHQRVASAALEGK